MRASSRRASKYSFGADIGAEAGFYANPLPEYGNLFDFPPELNATLEMTVTVSQ